MAMYALEKWFFILHIPITIVIDLFRYYPDCSIFSLSHSINRFYIKTFADPVVGGLSYPGGWFRSLIFLEGAVQLPICIFVVLQYWRNRQDLFVTKLWILMYSVQVATATWACVFEILSFEPAIISDAGKLTLLGFYSPYLIVPAAMIWTRVSQLIRENASTCKELDYLTKTPRSKATINKRILITGANSGVGFGIVKQLIDQSSQALLHGDLFLTLILSVRNETKANLVLGQLSLERQRYGKYLIFDFVFIDLTSMETVENAARSLSTKYANQPIDFMICNAGMAEFVKLDLYKAALQTLTNPLDAISAPNYKIQSVGGRTKDGLGKTFQANVFGHYYLISRLTSSGIIRSSHSNVIWMSSLEATRKAFRPDDMQAIHHEFAYESSKRLIDILWSESPSKRTFLVHPGFCTTSIVSEILPAIFSPVWTWVFYLARFFGMKYHTATAYNGAYAAATIALNPDEYDSGKKWGSAGTWDGQSYVDDTPYEPIEDASDTMQRMNSLRDSWIHRLS